MTAMELEAHMGRSVTIDMCAPCQAFWFDKYESLQLTPESTAQLLKVVREHSTQSSVRFPTALKCPRCEEPLLQTMDMQGSTKFGYWRCRKNHGRFTRFFDFLREKNFVRVLSPKELMELRKKVQMLNCTNCGAPINLTEGSACAHCGSPISIFNT
jgi:hypothetical protein